MISINEAKKMAGMEDVIVVDLRSEKDFLSSHIENAINIPAATLKEINSFDRKKYRWVLYCKRGSYSFKLASEMANNGYIVIAVVGGYK
ncbi:rhodanese-like domain-containing protein [uncultured Eubacterium sp.]|nr:rhodanese-like domain-containing protein [uncultured Eubacterium sp.]